jgi:hypothetical protein
VISEDYESRAGGNATGDGGRTTIDSPEPQRAIDAFRRISSTIQVYG